MTFNTQVHSLAALNTALRAASHDLVITDERLPWADGLAVLQAVKAHDPFCPVLMVTSTGDEKGAVAAMRAGLDDCVLKRPGSIERLPVAVLAALSRAVDRRHIAALEQQQAEMVDQLHQALREKDQALREKDDALELLDVLFQRAPVGLAFIDPSFRYLRINETLAATNGRPVAEHLGRTVREVLPDLAPVVEPIFAQLLASGEALTDVEVVEPHADGSQRIWQASYYPVQSADGSPLGIEIVATDVTQRRQAEEALRASETRFRLIAETIQDVFWITDPHQPRALYVSPAFEQVWGRPLAELYARYDTWLDAIHPDDRTQVQEAVQTQVSAGSYDTTYRIVRPDGSLRWVRDRGFPVTSEGGTVLYAVGVAEDITERQTLQARVREQMADLETFMETVPIAVLISDDAACTEIFGNRAAAQLLRTPLRANLSKTAAVVELPVNHQVLRDGRVLCLDELPMQLVGRTGVPLDDDELEIRFDDGEVKYIAGSVSPRFDAAGQVRGVIAAYVDLTERQRLDTLQRLFAQLSADLVSSLDYPEMLQRVTQLTVPALADYSVLDVVEPGGRIMRGAVAHYDPALAETAAQLHRYPPYLQRDAGVSEVLRRGEPLVLPVIAPSVLAAAAHDDEHLALLKSLGPCSCAILPLTARGATIGALSLIMSGSGRRITEGSLPTLQEFATRVALAIDNAHLYDEERAARAQLEQFSARLARLQAITGALSAALRQEDVARVFVEQAIPAAGAQGGGVMVLSTDGRDVVVLGASGFGDEQLAPWRRFPLEEHTPAAEVVRTGASVFLTSLDEWAQRFPAAAPAVIERGYPGYAGIPLSYEGRTIGAMTFNFAAPRSFSQDDQEFLRVLAQQCAQALERARLYEAEQVARAAAQEAVQLRDTFFSVTTHELRTPLTSLLGHAQLLQRRLARESALPERDRRALDIVVEQAQRLSNQISDLLDVARLTQGQFSVSPEPVDVCALVQRLVEGVQPTLVYHTVVCEDDGEPLLVLGDAARLEQVVQNLIQNAIKYSPDGGPVRVRVSRDDNQVLVSVSDQGMGIPATALPNLFQRFYRSGHERVRGIGGLGVGLYVVKEIIALHGGTVDVTSTEGAGSTFTVRLPYEPMSLATM